MPHASPAAFLPPLQNPTALATWLAWRASTTAQARLAQWCCSAAAGPAPLQGSSPPAFPGPKAAHWALAWRQVEALALLGLRVVPVWQLPARLAQVRPLPLLLFVRGNVRLLAHPRAVALVGSRRAHPHATAWAQSQAAALASAGHLVVSGGAVGVDAAAHEGALLAGGATLAFVGLAIDRIYPRLNAGLFARLLAQGGALVSEHPPLSVTFGAAHAARNRFIAALAQVVVVVEAGASSGTLRTAQFAHRLARPVVCAPAYLGGARTGIDALCAAGTASAWGSDGLRPYLPCTD